MTLPLRKAVPPVAGIGTRFLPAIKAMQKQLLPIIDKPFIQYAMNEEIEAWVTDLVFIPRPSKILIKFLFVPPLRGILKSDEVAI
ncbi:sugar phosphate nucleotidyltransferase [Seohaeicola saemankumensis]|uniref:UTP--glucose-1-phosphate uridylyltransferase n=1 Tax=Seohaeicola saemankumensis TaxID=481181 RepID=A0ABW3TED5_9RHOB